MRFLRIYTHIRFYGILKLRVFAKRNFWDFTYAAHSLASKIRKEGDTEYFCIMRDTQKNEDNKENILEIYKSKTILKKKK